MEDMNEIIWARNTEDGTVGQYRRFFVEHPVIGARLEEVPMGTKPRIPLKTVVEAFEQAKSEEDTPEEEENDG